MSESPAPDAAPAPKPKSKVKTLIMIALPVLLLGGGAWWYLRPAPADAAEHPKEEAAIETLGVLAMDTFLVNLTDEGGGRFLKAKVDLVFESQAEADRVKDNEAMKGHARSATLELLTQQDSMTLVTTEGKEALKAAIKNKVSSVLKEPKVVDVLFSDFVVQF